MRECVCVYVWLFIGWWCVDARDRRESVTRMQHTHRRWVFIANQPSSNKSNSTPGSCWILTGTGGATVGIDELYMCDAEAALARQQQQLQHSTIPLLQ